MFLDKMMIKFVDQYTFNIEMNSDIADWVGAMGHDRFIKYISFNIYGVPDVLGEDLETAYYEGDVSCFIEIGRLTGYYIPFDEILEAGEDPVIMCDDLSADLSLVGSILFNYYEDEETFLVQAPNVFYIDELEIDEQYRNVGFGGRVLQELSHLLKFYNGVDADLLAYYPAPTQYKDAERTPYEDAIMRDAVRKINEYHTGIPEKNNDKIVAMPIRNTKKQILDMIEEEKNKQGYPEELKSTDLFRFYEKNGFEEYRCSRLLIKIV